MRYETAREILAEAMELIGERKLFDYAAGGHATIGSNPKARKFNPWTAKTNKVKKRKWERGVGRTMPSSVSHTDAQQVHYGRAIIKDTIREALEQLDEANEDHHAKLKRMQRENNDLWHTAFMPAEDLPKHVYAKKTSKQLDRINSRRNPKAEAAWEAHSKLLQRHVRKMHRLGLFNHGNDATDNS